MGAIVGGGAILVVAVVTCTCCGDIRSKCSAFLHRCFKGSGAPTNAAAVRQSIYVELCRLAQPRAGARVAVNEAEANRMSLSYFDPKTRSSDGRVPSENWVRWVSNHISINFPAEHRQDATNQLTAPPLNYNDNVRSYR